MSTNESFAVEGDVFFQAAIKKIYDEVNKSEVPKIIQLPSCFKEYQLDMLCKFFKDIGFVWKLVDNGS